MEGKQKSGARTMWNAPSAPPPLSTSAVRPKACRVSRMKPSLSASASSGPSQAVMASRWRCTCARTRRQEPL